jgi:4-hydroxy-tetrahydrodipicolinate synthase
MIFEQGNPAGIKSVLVQRGICGDTLRLPLVNVNDHLHAKIDRFIKDL